MFIKWTRCEDGWPLIYRTYHQETEPPYRHAAACTVFRCWRAGIVVGRWTGQAIDEDDAHAAALNARQVPLLDDDGDLLDNFRRHRTTP